MKCSVCGKELKNRQYLFCSKKCKNKTYNASCQHYDRQREKGKIRRMTLVQYKGGKCEICGYSKCLAALTFHHRKPKIKSFEIDLRSCANRSIEKLIDEVHKCSLLCFNCHMELHYGT
jgi:hypothetical protein